MRSAIEIDKYNTIQYNMYHIYIYIPREIIVEHALNRDV